MNRSPRNHGFTLVELLVVIGIIALLISILLPSLMRAREMSNRVQCASNLRQIGQAMLIYATENKGDYPRTYYNPASSIYADGDAVDSLGTGATASNSFDSGNLVGTNNLCAAIFLLLRTQNLGAEVFICPSTGADREPDNFGGGTNSAHDRSNFSSKLRNLSYGMAIMYPSGRSGTGNPSYRWERGSLGGPEFVIAGDMGQGSAGDVIREALTPTSPESQLRIGNSPNHGQDGQNVLFGDGHVGWTATPFAGGQTTGPGPGPLWKGPDCIYGTNGGTANAWWAANWSNGGHPAANAYDSCLLPTRP